MNFGADILVILVAGAISGGVIGFILLKAMDKIYLLKRKSRLKRRG